MAGVRRRRRAERPGKFTTLAIEAYKRGDWLTLRKELGMKPWEWGKEIVMNHPRVADLRAHIEDANGHG